MKHPIILIGSAAFRLGCSGYSGELSTGSLTDSTIPVGNFDLSLIHPLPVSVFRVNDLSIPFGNAGKDGSFQLA